MRVLSVVMVSLVCSSALAQAPHYTEKDYAQRPVWISMIDDTSSNYFEVQKAFNTWFKYHPRPGEEHDVIGEDLDEPRRVSKRQLRRMQAEDLMRMEVKKYENWRFQMEPYVREDGFIPGPEQRLQMWRAETK